MDKGGSYIIDPQTGAVTRVEEPTQPHAQGDMPRTAAGQVIGANGLPVAELLPVVPVADPAPPIPAESPEEPPAVPATPTDEEEP